MASLAALVFEEIRKEYYDGGVSDFPRPGERIPPEAWHLPVTSCALSQPCGNQVCECLTSGRTLPSKSDPEVVLFLDVRGAVMAVPILPSTQGMWSTLLRTSGIPHTFLTEGNIDSTYLMGK